MEEGTAKGGGRYTHTHRGSMCAEAERIVGVRLVRLNVFNS